MTVTSLDAVVVGAGPAGLGTALALGAVHDLALGVLERGGIGQTFLDWPEQQTFLTPSFTGNGFGATDLNAVHPLTSPAFTLGVDYLTGTQYASYLATVARHFHVPILDDTEVLAVRQVPEGFELESTRGPVTTRALVWAGGEHHDPLEARVSGSGLADHSSTREAWRPRGEGELVVIGGYESGIDIACYQVKHGARVTIVDGSAPWDASGTSDPSALLAPRTRQRFERARATGRLEVVRAHASAVKRDGEGFVVSLGNGSRIRSGSRPIAATGFGPGLGPVERLFARRADGWPALTEDDESTIAPGLFLSGPAVRHGGIKFCFVYKFRQRFAHIARVIGERAGKDCGALEQWRTAGMLTDDLSCCGAECAC